MSAVDALAELIAQHAPYLSKNSDNKLCLRCLDSETHGEFATIDDWSRHVAWALTRAGYGKKRAAVGERDQGLFS
ncbi:MAG: hypothetical protein VYA67_22125 [Actinomycetota bacterium]|nr:hypothetical protein [Actinomycetota bacterium]